MTTLLLTGFEPFGGDAENASQTIVRAVADRWGERVPGVQLRTAILPVAYRAADARLRALLDEEAADVVIALGEAGGRRVVTPELRARNLDNARIPDNDGEQPTDRPIDPDGADLDERMGVEAIADAGKRAGLPIAASDDAGTFLCNHVFYRLMQWTDVPGGFVHVPAWRSSGAATVGAETDAVVSPAAAIPELDVLVETVEFVLDRCWQPSAEPGLDGPDGMSTGDCPLHHHGCAPTGMAH